MKKQIQNFAAGVIASLLFYLPAQAQWTTNGPYGGVVGELLYDSGTLYAGAGSNVYKSTNDGATWSETGDNTIHAITGLVASGGKIFAGTGNFQGVMVSADGGVTWDQKNNGLSGGMIDVMFVNQAGVYAAIDEKLFFTSNGGNSWSQIGSGLSTNIEVLEQYGDTLFAGTGGEHGSLYMSTDDGQNFTHVIGFPAMHAVYTLACDGDNLYAGTWFGVFKSSDRGATWTMSNAGISGGYTKSMMVVQGKILVSTLEGGFFVSSDDGATWAAANSGLMGWGKHTTAPFPHALDLAETGSALVAATDDGIYRSTDGGASWSRANDQIKGNRMLSVAAKGNFVCGGAGRMYVSSSQGGSWNLAHNGIEGSSILAITIQGNAILASTGNQKLYKSTDNAASWTLAGSGILGRADVLASNDQRVAAIVRNTATGDLWLMLSNDGGMNFSNVPGASVITGRMRALGLFEDRIYVGNDRGMVFRSDDGGATWRDIGSYLPYVEITAILPLEEETYVATSGKGVFRFTSNDYVVENFSGGLPNYQITDLVKEGEFVFASTGGAGIFATLVGVENWFQVSDDLEDKFVTKLAAANGKVYAATSTGVYQTGDGAFETFMIRSGVEEVNAGFVTLFPNPAHHTIYCRVTGHAQLTIYDSEGKLLRTTDIDSKGELDISGFRAGIYFLKVQLADGVSIKKIIVQ